MKKVIVINGKGGAGKDTLCEFAAKKYSVMNISAITPIKSAASLLGWNGEKTDTARKFLADLKQLSIEYNDFPNQYLVTQYKEFLTSQHQILFVHIRESDQISRFISSVNGSVSTLLIRRPGNTDSYGNAADDNVESFTYDYIYINNKPLIDAENDFLDFLGYIVN